MLTAILISVFLLFFPIFIKTNLNYKNFNNNLFFNIKLFNFIRIIYGKIKVENLNVLIFYNKNKFKKVKLSSLLFNKNKMGNLSEFTILKIESSVFFGGHNLEYLFALSSLFYVLNNLFCKLLKHKKNYLKIENNLNIFTNEYMFNFNTEIKIIFNLFAIIYYFISKIKRKILNERKI
ncbi:MAG: hypothetical protein IJW43_04675 [Clostridia bacterium]|nr:hypothetical protein [Clostridia bacterium]